MTKFKFKHEHNAEAFSNHTEKSSIIILGDNNRYWVVSLADGQKLVKQGYQTRRQT